MQGGFRCLDVSYELASGRFADVFLSAYRKTVEDADLADSDERGFYLPCRVSDIARSGSFGHGGHAMGSRKKRV